MNSKQIAGLIGPTVISITISEAINLHIWTINIPQVTYLNGLVLFVAGLSIARIHNCWRGWPIYVTLAGWFLLLFGLYRMFFPEAKQASQNPATYTGIFFLLTIGIFLTFKAYSREKNVG
jgi:hypothetical protein